MSTNVPNNCRPPVSLVLGGSGVIGSKIVQELRQDGRCVVVVDKDPPELPDVAFYSLDLLCPQSIENAVGSVIQRYGAPDSLICAAGFLCGGPALTVTQSEIQRHLDINLLGVVRLSQQAAKAMLADGGKILFLSSIHGQIGVPDRAAYAMSKAALGAWARAMAVELAPFKIRVNLLAPGAASTGMGPDPKARSFWTSNTPAGRVADACEIARFAAFLTSDDASFVTGQTIALDGGASNLRPYGLTGDS